MPDILMPPPSESDLHTRGTAADAWSPFSQRGAGNTGAPVFRKRRIYSSAQWQAKYREAPFDALDSHQQ